MKPIGAQTPSARSAGWMDPRASMSRCVNTHTVPAASRRPSAKRANGIWRITTRALLLSSTRQVAELAQYCHIIPGHTPLNDLCTLQLEHRAEIKIHSGTGGRKWAHRSLLRTIVRTPRGDDVPFRNQMRDGLHRI